MAVDDDTAVVWGRFGGTAPSGAVIEVPVCFVGTVREGLIHGDVGYYDPRLVQMHIGEAAAFVEAFAEMWRAPSRDGVRALVDDGIRAVVPGSTEPFIGGDEYADRVAGLLAVAPDVTIMVDRWSALNDDGVAIEWRGQTTIGERTLNWQGVDHFRLRGGQAVEALVMFDSAPLLAAIEAAASRD